MSDPKRSDALRRAELYSPFLAGLLRRDGWPVGETDPAAIAGVSIITALRVARRRVALEVAIDDLSGAAELAAVTERLTAFADRALDLAITAAIEERGGTTSPSGFVAIALGKQGSRELNYSSDIDPIFLYDPATIPCRPREDPADAAVRIARRVMELLQSRDADGYVLRVDLRLRPSSEITPIALPVEAAISYYESQALPWERAAFIRARACAGDIALGQGFIDAIAPFVWRRSLDYGAIDEITGITRRIRDHHAQGQAFGPGYDLKRGRGGIREIEFYAQVHQLIHGGRDRSLRASATRPALAALAAAGRISLEDAETLSDAYVLLRTIEHRVQMVDDRQTHTLPHGEGLDRVARLHDSADGDALLAMLSPHVTAVAAIFDRLMPEQTTALSTDPLRLQEQLGAVGIADPSAADRITTWRSGRYPALRSPAAVMAFERVLPALAKAIGAASAPIVALTRLDRMLARLPSAVNVFRLLDANPALLTLFADVLAQAPTLAEELATRPELLDGLLDASALQPVRAVEPLIAAMSAPTLQDDYQARLDLVRRVVGEQRFALGVQIVAAASDPLQVSHGYALLAEAALSVLTAATIEDFARAHGRVPDSEFVVLALGRLGGGALTHASDLDLIYLFTGDFMAESDGARPLGATLYYNRLAQRVTAALSVATAAGPLYEVDTRLRPSGTQGPLVVSVDTFARYQRESAWTWEHMALTRARPVFGSDAARAAASRIIAGVLNGDRPDRDVPADVADMRAEMVRHKPPAGPLDVKLRRGGLVDLEFAVHLRQLVHRTAFDVDLARAIDHLIEAGLLPAETRGAYALFARLLVVLRLMAPDAAEPDRAIRDLIVRIMDAGDWTGLNARVDAAAALVSGLMEERS